MQQACIRGFLLFAEQIGGNDCAANLDKFKSRHRSVCF